ncbi:hypothetical protein ABFY48_23215 [Lysinibacillus pakistanensis]|uniref:hypothetical protein n=1 Tax=Lysinibacillus pakistanensis TaxID=759811 RepID=UPI003D278BAF
MEYKDYNKLALDLIRKFTQINEINENIIDEHFQGQSNDFEGVVFPKGMFPKDTKLNFLCGGVRLKNGGSTQFEVYFITENKNDVLSVILSNSRIMDVFVYEKNTWEKYPF